MTLSALRAACVTAFGLALAATAQAQPVEIDWSGVAWIDYAYTVSDEDPDLRGANSFDYRRIYLTADAALHDDVRVRVRLEAAGQAITEAGRPSPFVKDAWIRWQYHEAGHRATLGVQPPPLFDTSEAVWGYRSLDRTIMDRSRVRSSRDMGLRLDGPLALGGDLRYAAMVGNGRGVRPEADGEQGKHVYGQLIYRPAESPFRATLGADYTAHVPNLPDAERRASRRVSGLAGAVTETFRVGAEGYVNLVDFDRAGTESETEYGVSVFGAVSPTLKTSLVGRYDYIRTRGPGPVTVPTPEPVPISDEHYVLAAVAYRPIPALEIMPNVIATFPEGVDATVLARVTVAATF